VPRCSSIKVLPANVRCGSAATPSACSANIGCGQVMRLQHWGLDQELCLLNDLRNRSYSCSCACVLLPCGCPYCCARLTAPGEQCFSMFTPSSALQSLGWTCIDRRRHVGDTLVRQNASRAPYRQPWRTSMKRSSTRHAHRRSCVAAETRSS